MVCLCNHAPQDSKGVPTHCHSPPLSPLIRRTSKISTPNFLLFDRSWQLTYHLTASVEKGQARSAICLDLHHDAFLPLSIHQVHCSRPIVAAPNPDPPPVIC